MPRTIHPPHRVDATSADWLRMVARLPAGDAEAARARAVAAFSSAGDALVFLSVRSAFDATLEALAWPAGTEVLVSAINIADMATLLRAHGLVPVPLPLDPATLQPRPDALADRVTPRARGLLLAHLFGARADATALVAAAKVHGLVVLEDAAQAFDGSTWRGTPGADVTYFSFGTIKTATALGGAFARVSDPTLRARVAALEATWPTQSRAAYARKVMRLLVFLALQPPWAYTAFCALCGAAGVEPGEIVRRMTRGFGGLSAEALRAALRHRPCAPLLHVLADRLAGFDPRRTQARAAWGRDVAAALYVPGAAHALHAHWLVPVHAAAPEAARVALRQAGLDASGPSNVVSIDDPAADALMRTLLFLPAYPELPPQARRGALDALRAAAGSPPAPAEPHTRPEDTRC